MDISGNNRYELLFMDDDSSASVRREESAVSKKKHTISPDPVKKINTVIAKKTNVEKENKSGALNNNDVVNKRAAVKGAPKSGTSGIVLNKSRRFEGELPKVAPKSGTSGIVLNKSRRFEGELPKVAFISQTDEVREKNTVRRNFLEAGEFGNEHREARQFRDRDNRFPARNREGVFRGGKREFDRQSGSDKTGVKAIDKRDGAGAHNWGSVKQEIDDINKSSTDATLTVKEEFSNEHTPEQPLTLEEEEEEVKELTLDEWKALRGERTKPQYNIRKPNEGADTSQWKKMVVLNKKKEGESEDEYEYDPTMYPQRVGRLQRILDIQFNFNDGRRGGSGFGRSRGRGLRPGGDNKSRPECDKQPRQQRNFGDRQQKRSTQNTLKVDDERQFPTLS